MVAVAGLLLVLWICGAAPSEARAQAEARRSAAAIVDAFAGMPARADGNVVDPVSQMGAPRYAQAVFGAAALRLWRQNGDPEARAFGERMLGWVASHPDPAVPSPFELAAAAEAYSLLPETSPVRAALARRLASAHAPFHARAGAPYTHNKQLVEAHGLLLLCRLRLRPDSAALCRRGRRLVLNALPAAARLLSVRHRGRAVAVLSDPPHSVPAYHHLVLGYLARTLPLVGSAPRAGEVLLSLARGSLALAAPDGDSAYFGRSQGQAWALVFGAYGLYTAADLDDDLAEAARLRANARRLLDRYAALHRGGPYGVLITPSFARMPLAAPGGLDTYANVATYSGLTALGLMWLTGASQDGPADAVQPASERFSFDRGRDAFGVVREGPVWLAVRRDDASDHAGDLRYDFGLVAAKRLVGDTWRPLVRARPCAGADSAGPVLRARGRWGHPDGERLSVTSDGAVVIDGGWRDRSGAWLRRARFRFAPTATGVRLTFPVRAGDRIRYSVFSPSPQLEGESVIDEGTRTQLPLARGRLNGAYASSDEPALVRADLEATYHRSRTVAVTFAG